MYRPRIGLSSITSGVKIGADGYQTLNGITTESAGEVARMLTLVEPAVSFPRRYTWEQSGSTLSTVLSELSHCSWGMSLVRLPDSVKPKMFSMPFTRRPLRTAVFSKETSLGKGNSATTVLGLDRTVPISEVQLA